MDRHKVNILLVEDEQAHAELVCRTFESRPGRFQLTVAGNLQEARDYLAESTPQLVIADLVLPDGKGIELLPAEEEKPRFPVVVMTAHGDEQVAVEAMKAGALDYVVKSAETLTDVPRIAERTLREWSLITECKQTEEALRQSEERYRTVLEASPDPTVLYDIEGKVVYFNPAFTDVFGWTLERRVGKKMDLFVPPENWPETKMMIERVLNGESFAGIDTRRYTKDGKVIPVCVSGAICRDEKGSPVGSVINLRDISKQKTLEAQLIQAQKMEAVGTLAGGIAHDFNNLLQAILGYTDLLILSKAPTNPDCSKLQKIMLAAQRGAELTQQLLTFSRKMESKKKPLDLNQAVGEVSKILERTIPKMIEVELHLAEDLSTVNADFGQIDQVIMNLALNATDAMPDGGKLTIAVENASLDEEFCRTHPEARPGDYALLTISDTGHGMDKETQTHIFDPFYTTKEIGKGTGLGLAMVYGIVKNHEGYITCQSELGQGTSFKIYLPVIRQETDLVEPGEQEFPVEGGTETILLVDDEEFIRDLGIDFLSKAGYRVIAARDGERALAVYRQKREQIDLVILDLLMPGMGGKKCLEELLKINPKAKVIIASGYFDSEPMKEAIMAGAKGFIGKPHQMTEFLRVVRQALDK